jgi:hypothetical protein
MKKLEIVAFYLVVAIIFIAAIVVSQLVKKSQVKADSIVVSELKAIERKESLGTVIVTDRQ